MGSAGSAQAADVVKECLSAGADLVNMY